jgi:hypothetical protein
MEIQTVRDLLIELGKFPLDAKVRCTWESICPAIDDIYITPGGTVLVDSSGGYRPQFESGKLVPYCEETE